MLDCSPISPKYTYEITQARTKYHFRQWISIEMVGIFSSSYVRRYIVYFMHSNASRSFENDNTELENIHIIIEHFF